MGPKVPQKREVIYASWPAEAGVASLDKAKLVEVRAPLVPSSSSRSAMCRSPWHSIPLRAPRADRLKHGETVTLSIQDDGAVTFAAGLGTVAAGLHGARLHDFLLGVWRHRMTLRKEFVSEVFGALGALLDGGMREHEWTTDPLLVLQQQGAQVRRRADRNLRVVALLELPGDIARRPSRATKLARRMKLECPAGQAWHDSIYMRRYLLSLRQAMRSGFSFGIAPDKSGFPPNEFLGTSIFCAATGKIGWMPPQVVDWRGGGGFLAENRTLRNFQELWPRRSLFGVLPGKTAILPSS